MPPTGSIEEMHVLKFFLWKNDDDDDNDDNWWWPILSLITIDDNDYDAKGHWNSDDVQMKIWPLSLMTLPLEAMVLTSHLQCQKYHWKQSLFCHFRSSIGGVRKKTRPEKMLQFFWFCAKPKKIKLLPQATVWYKKWPLGPTAPAQ